MEEHLLVNEINCKEIANKVEIFLANANLTKTQKIEFIEIINDSYKCGQWDRNPFSKFSCEV